MALTKSGITNSSIVVDDITKIPNYILQQLDCGDIAIEKVNEEITRVFRLSYKEQYGDIHFSFVDLEYVVVVSYVYNSDTKEWEYNKTQQTAIGGSSGTKLYKHHLQDEYGGCVFEFISTNPNQIAFDDYAGNTLDFIFDNNPQSIIIYKESGLDEYVFGNRESLSIYDDDGDTMLSCGNTEQGNEELNFADLTEYTIEQL